MAKKIITRFPPSPTGFLHLGGARTALFNWLYARHTGGKFVLRIEDTDTARSTKEAVDAIFEGLKWLEIDWDDGPYYQTQRLDIYQEYIRKLLDDGKAYWCECTPGQVEEMRKKGRAESGRARYDGTCREKGLGPGRGRVVRFKAPAAGVTIIEDRAKGAISVPNSEMDDFIIQRSDGMPTYNFVVVVDDMTMGVNTIIRGDDHISNTPRQIQLYKAFGAEIPEFAHVPMVLGPDKTKLSKRHGSLSVTEYRDMGFLPEAMINYLVRLGWSCGDREFFTRGELVEHFSMENFGKSAGIFDMEKLKALNAEHIRAADDARLRDLVRPFLEAEGIEAEDEAYLDQVLSTLRERARTLVEMAKGARFYYREMEYEEKAARKNLKAGALAPLKALAAELEQLETFEEKALEGAFLAVMESLEIKLGKIAQPLRVALTGASASPGIFEILAILGKETALRRLRRAIQWIEAKPEEKT
ncbi:MAG: glutamate--tRNA ligase [Desulfobacterales bacterium]|nr:MAG: glutamate--tRNA ligase [Desulfobacterales bacterium]